MGARRTPGELTRHACINLRLPTHGSIYARDFEDSAQSLHVSVDGPLTFNSINPNMAPALDGCGLAYLGEQQVGEAVTTGRLEAVLADWTPDSPGYHIYYPSRRQASPAFKIILDALRHRPI